MEDRFEMGMDVICIKEYGLLKVGRRYHIDGCGGLCSFGSGCKDKTGYGFSVKEYQDLRKSNPIWYYFTEKEMSEYFITEEENYKMHIRDKKINELL
jgi:hypothetical protein